MILQSAQDTLRAEEQNKTPDLNPHLIKYVIDKFNGQIYSSGDIRSYIETDDDMFYYCFGLQSALNSQWSFGDDPDGQFSSDAISSHIEEHFDEWYGQEVVPRNVALGRA